MADRARRGTRTDDEAPFSPSSDGGLKVDYGPSPVPDPNIFQHKSKRPSEREKGGMPPLPKVPKKLRVP